MACDVSVLLSELSLRGLLYGATKAQARSAAEQAQMQLAAYCGLPEGVLLPEGLFYGWLALTGALLQSFADTGAARVKSISEGDRSVSFLPPQSLPPECRAIADRYRRFG